MKNIFKRLFGLLCFHKWKYYTILQRRENTASLFWHEKRCVWCGKIKDVEYSELIKNKEPLTQTTKASEVNQTTQSDTFNQWKDIVIRDND